MNDLNSVLIEGTIINEVDFVKREGTTICKFTLISNRYFKMNDEMEKEVTTVNIASRSKLAENCHKMANKGRQVRVVGRLKQDNDTLLIEAEHIEFRPIFTKNKQTDKSLFDDGENNV